MDDNIRQDPFEEAVNADGKPRLGQIFPGQAWVELHGYFTAIQLKDIASQIDKRNGGAKSIEGRE